jgi:2-hydroxy-6-oxonona-2,4-dienedioate hydrolase
MDGENVIHVRDFPRLSRDGSDVPVVLVHGVGVSSRYMVPTALALRQWFRVIAPDLPGFGRSPRARGTDRTLDIGALAEALGRCRERLQLTAPVLVGNSFGCQVAVELALRHPDRVRALVLQGPTVDPAARSWSEQLLRWLLNGLREPPSMALVIARDYLDCGTKRLLRTFAFALRDPIDEKLADLEQPVLVVRGTSDVIVPRAWACRAAELPPHGRLVEVDGAAHTLNFSHPRALAAEVRGFVEALDL